jgi:hypothetical protein
MLPLIGNWRAASRAGEWATREWARDVLNSVEPYGILFTYGDNDTFPLWYAQEVEGIRKDVVVANTSLLNTDWYVRQIVRRPVYAYDAAKGPAIYAGTQWKKPSGPPLKMTLDEADSIPQYSVLSQPMRFDHEDLHVTIDPRALSLQDPNGGGGLLQRADIAVLRMIKDSWGERPIYFSRTSGGYATACIGFFYLLTFVLGFGAMVLIGRQQITAVDAGGNMAAPLLAAAVGGTAFFGFISAVAFATILAVVAGLTLSGAATLSHDLWVNVVRKGDPHSGEELVVARVATVALAVVSIVLGILFKGQNVAYMVGLAFAIAASANFPVLVLSIFWSRLTTAGAQASTIVGTVSALVLIWLSPAIQIDVLKHEAAWFPLRNPGIVTIPLAFAVAIVVSWLRPVPEEARAFHALERQIHLGTE